MYSVYYNRTTPVLAFFEGMVRSFDWGALVELVKRRQRNEPERERRRDKGWSERIVTWYIRDSISAFEAEETRKLARDAMLYRCRCSAANVMLGPMPTKDVILRYENMVPGACDRIMNRASERLEQDGRCRTGAAEATGAARVYGNGRRVRAGDAADRDRIAADTDGQLLGRVRRDGDQRGAGGLGFDLCD